MVEAWKKHGMCDRKMDYNTLSAANRFGTSRNLRAYECPFCHCWHLTSNPVRRPEQIELPVATTRERQE